MIILKQKRHPLNTRNGLVERERYREDSTRHKWVKAKNLISNITYALTLKLFLLLFYMFVILFEMINV